MLTEEYWEELAKARGVRLPRRDAKWSQRNWLNRIGLAATDYSKYLGGVGEFRAANPAWTFRQWAGLALEIQEQLREADGRALFVPA